MPSPEPGCYKCGREVEGKISFRMSCLSCCSDLHVCKNCRYYVPGKPNDCMVPGTDPIRDREAANFCEEFAFLFPTSNPLSPVESPLKKAKRLLFGDLDSE